MDLLADALERGGGRGPGEAIREKLLQSAARDVQELLPHLEPRAADAGAIATQRLAERGEREAKSLVETLERQKARVAEELARYEGRDMSQLTLGFDADERRQLEADVRSWRGRLQQFERDLASEPDRIRDFYHVRASRVEPVGLVYLWPETN